MIEDDRIIIIAGMVYEAEFLYYTKEDFISTEHRGNIFIVPIETTCSSNSKTFKAIVIQSTGHYNYTEYKVGSIMDFDTPKLPYGYDAFTYKIVEDFKL